MILSTFKNPRFPRQLVILRDKLSNLELKEEKLALSMHFKGTCQCLNLLSITFEASLLLKKMKKVIVDLDLEMLLSKCMDADLNNFKVSLILFSKREY